MSGAPAPTEPPAEPARLPRTVVWFGVVSFLTDASGEMIYPLVPLFLTSVLGGTIAFVGIIEGVAEATAALFKLVSGRIADRVPRKKPLVVFGYTLSTLARPLVSLAGSPWHVLLARFADRIGKGVRSSPRDALVADVTPRDQRGRAYGYHRAMDNGGAVLGPLVGFGLMYGAGLGLRAIFALAIVPGLLAVTALVLGVREAPREPAAPAASQQKNAATPQDPEEARRLRRYLLTLALFTLGNASDAFLLVRAAQVFHPDQPLGSAILADPRILLLWTLHNGVKALLSQRGGALSDRVGRRRVIVAGWAVYALTYLAFAYAVAPWQIWALFAFYAGYYALVEGAEKAMVADLAGEGRRGRAFGLYHAVVGAMSLPASALFGFLYKTHGALAAFGTAAALAALGSLLLYALVPEPDARA